MPANPSPICTVNGLATPQDVASGASFTIALANPAGAQFWSIQCTSTDELGNASTTSATIVPNMSTKTATCSAPAQLGSALIFTSIVGTVAGLGLDANGQPQPAFTTTFKVSVPTAAGQRVLATNEGSEQSSGFGWVGVFNSVCRAIAASGLTAAAVAGFGLWHSTGSTLDGAAYRGTADQLLVTNHAGTDTAWTTLGGDALYASGSLTVTGLRGKAITATAPTDGQVLTYVAAHTDYEWVTPTVSSSAITAFGADLAGSTATNQWVAAISGPGGAGGVVPVNATTLQFAATQASPTLSQARSTTGAGQTLSLVAQQAKATSGGAGGGLTLTSGAGDGAGANGTISLMVASTPVASLTAAAGDFLRFGATPAGTGFLRVPNATTAIVARNAAGTQDLALVATDASNNMTFGSTSQGLATYLQGPTGGSANLTVGGTLILAATSAQVGLSVQNLSWAAAVATPTITQATATGNVPASSLLFAPQIPSATALGINRNGTHVIAQLPGASNGGTVSGTFRVTQNGSVVASFAPNGLVQGTQFQSLWLGTTVGAESGSNFALTSDGSTLTVLNGPTGVQLQIANAAQLALTTSSALLTPALLQFTAGTSAPSFGQAAQTSNVAAANLTIGPQAPFASATGTNRNGTTLILALPAATNGGTVAGTLRLTQAGNGVVSVGPNALSQGTQFQSLWFGSAVGAESGGNFGLASDGSTLTVLNGPTGVQLQIANVAGAALTASGLQLFSGTAAFGGGSGVLGITNATTSPTTAPSGGAVLFATAGGLAAMGSGQASYEFTPPGTGTINSQTGKWLRRAAFGRTTITTTQTVLTIPVPTNTVATFVGYLATKNTGSLASSGATGTAATFVNAAGTVSQIGASTTLYGHGTVGLSYAVSGTNVVVQVSGNASTLDHQVDVYVAVN